MTEMAPENPNVPAPSPGADYTPIPWEGCATLAGQAVWARWAPEDRLKVRRMARARLLAEAAQAGVSEENVGDFRQEVSQDGIRFLYLTGTIRPDQPPAPA